MTTNIRYEASITVQNLLKVLRERLAQLQHDLVTNEVLIKYIPNKIIRNENGIITGCGWGREPITKPSYRKLSLWMMDEFGKMQEYQTTLATLVRLFGLSEKEIHFALSSFLCDAITSGTNGNLNLLLDDLESKPCLWEVKVNMFGIIPETNEIKLAEGMKLRRVNEQDISFEEEPSLFHGIVPRIPHSVLEVLLSFPSINEMLNKVQGKIETLIILFSLFKESATSYVSYTVKPRSYRVFGVSTFSQKYLYASEPIAIIKESEATNLAKFIEYFEQKIPETIIFGHPSDPLEISLKRYLDSIKGNVPVEERLTYAVMGLEALFLENMTELRFKLALRTSLLLGYLNEDPDTVFTNISEAYHYRSLYVHGSVLSPEEAVKARQILDKVWRYLRKSILIWLVEGISSRDKKQQFLKQLDTAFINDSKRQILKERLEGIKPLLQGAI